jgi:hypothetical protein
MIQTWWTDFPKILEPPQNSRRQKIDMKQGPYCGPTHIRRRRTTFICPSDLAPVICASLFQTTSLSCPFGFNRSARANLYRLIPASILGVRTAGTVLLMVILKTCIKISLTYHCLFGITVSLQFVNIICESKIRLRTGHEGPERE